MIVLLKIILSALCIALGCTIYFVYSQYNKFRKSIENEGASLMEKFMVGVVTFASTTLLTASIVFFVFVIISKLTIVLPF